MRTTFLYSLLAVSTLACSQPSPDATPEPEAASTPGPAEPEAPEATAAEGRGGIVLPAGQVPSDPEALLAAHLGALGARGEHQVPQIEVQHILVGVTHRALRGVSRTIDQARSKTADILQQIAGGADFGALVKEHTDDSPPGIYGMVLQGPGNQREKIYARDGMVAAFGNVGWKLEVGEVGVAPHHPQDSYYGFHIIKRTK